MNLHAISYLNIGPFRDQVISIFFGMGKYLIKSPIGSGKSFLFFDGPMYGLYKYSSRPMTNSFSKTGFIKLYFEVDGEDYFVVRNLKKGKSKDSCSSKFFRVEKGFQLKQKSGIEKSTDIQELLSPYLEEISFKNETDLQQTLSTILPPREVFMSTIFLMQDADNIFELLPADRLNVLKNVFGLLGIDEAKDRIAEKKRTLNTEIKIKSNTEVYDSKLKNYLASRLSTYKNLQSSKLLEHADIDRKRDAIQELEHLADKIQMQNFSQEHLPIELVDKIKGFLEEKKTKHHSLRQQIEQLQKDISEQKNNSKTIVSEQHQLKQKQESINKTILAIDPQRLANLKKEKQTITEEEENIHDTIDTDHFESFWNIYKENELFDDWQENPIFSQIATASSFVSQLINAGKVLKEELHSFDIQEKQLEQEEKHLRDQLRDIEDPILLADKQKQAKKLLESKLEVLFSEQKNIEDKLKSHKEQLKKFDEKIAGFETFIAEQANFHCDKINSYCPFIKQINKKSFEQLESKKESLLQEKEESVADFQAYDYDKKLSETAKKISEKKKTIMQISEDPKNFFKDFFTEIETKKTKINQELKAKNFAEQRKTIAQKSAASQQFLDTIKLFLDKIDRKKIKELYTHYQKLDEKKRTLDKDILVLEQETSKLETYKLELEKINTQLERITKDLEDLEKLLQERTIAEQKLQQQLQEGHFAELPQLEKWHDSITQQFAHISELIHDFKVNQIELLKKKEEEKIVNNLYHIFSKELLLLVLEDSLPTLADIINAFLAQVVDYQINFFLSKSASDKLELEAKIYDEKGEREVKSLSGGQKIVLKLVWMLAISSYVGSEMLFLDETINNLDQETVGKVADMLEDFVQKREVKLYTVTHSQQIQDMDIWDGILGI